METRGKIRLDGLSLDGEVRYQPGGLAIQKVGATLHTPTQRAGLDFRPVVGRPWLNDRDELGVRELMLVFHEWINTLVCDADKPSPSASW